MMIARSSADGGLGRRFAARPRLATSAMVITSMPEAVSAATHSLTSFSVRGHGVSGSSGM
jgi:hypothetical protein